ncbi:uncharacterized protein apof [Phyllopteryx taeniolatus]|uniref:uncharacterized protein apof n=1 Tax=Phyllopteryx taeniolatus TaxID=161469 RepID=UPI002AD2E670|nr:uncharacterized protein apof [Phyllopteryx taeniolatus]XP_061642079.1 uncharacterized protein apof [Phyllopteryx taeniolatus]
MMSSKLKWLIVVQLLLNEQALCTVHPSSCSPANGILGAGETAKPYPQTQPQFGLPIAEKPDPESTLTHAEKSLNSAKRIVSVLKAKLQGKIPDVHNERNISCGELLSASALDDPLSSRFPQELLGLALVPVLVVASCPREAHTLVVKLYGLLGMADTNELLLEVEGLIQRRTKLPSEPTKLTWESDEAGRHLEAVIFNIQQLATVGKSLGRAKKRQNCDGWTRVNGTMLLGEVVQDANSGLEEAMDTCERMGVTCAGVTSGGLPGRYQVVFKKGSHILPSQATDSWIYQCSAELSGTDVSARRLRRDLQRRCINQKEERVYKVVEWIPAVSTLYNLGTAVYYASVNCSETAKERAVLTAVDLGTDALMAATGGAAGVAGYAIGAGLKTGVKAGVKYLLGSLKHEDVLVNQSSWEEGVFTVQ